MRKKVIIAIADGIGDRPCPILNNMTPLQYAKTPTLDALAVGGTTGLMDLVKPGLPVGTDIGHLILFGYSVDDYPGRGPLEASGVGMDLQNGDVAFRCNFATVDQDGIVLDRRANRIREGTSALAAALSGVEIDGVQVFFKEATEHRAVLLLRGENLSSNISDSDPKNPKAGLKYCEVLPLDDTPNAQRTADVTNKFLAKAHELLKEHPVNIKREAAGELPANFILTRGAGQMLLMEKITDKLGFKGACVAGESTVLGVANLTGYTAISDDKMTANLDTNIDWKVSETLRVLETNDIVFLHLKATDLMGHDGNPKGKVQAIELFEKMVAKLVEQRPKNTIIALCADHSTPCERKEHSGDPVPVLINGPGIRVDQTQTYDEIACSSGGLNRMTGSDFITSLMDQIELVPKCGN